MGVQKHITTIGIDYGVKPVKVAGQDLKVNFFDTSGGDEFREIRVEFYSNTNGVLLAYDVTKAKAYNSPLSKLHKSGELPFVVLCANKTDLPKRQVTKAEGMQFAAKHGMYYFETSASSGENVIEAMNCIFEKYVQHHVEMRKKLGAG